MQFPQWFPLSVIKGSAAANTLVKSLDSEWGKKLYGKTLIRQIGMSLYRDRKNIERKLRREVRFDCFSMHTEDRSACCWDSTLGSRKHFS